MKRLMLLLAVPISVIVGVWVADGCSHREVVPLVEAGQRHYQPLLDALEAYRVRHGTYPHRLNELVDERLIGTVPTTPPAKESHGHFGEPEYRRREGGQSYTLTFWYHLKNQWMLGDSTYATWDSAEQKWTMRGPGY